MRLRAFTILLSLFVIQVHASEFQETNLRTWTSTSGAKLEAEFVSHQYGMVTLRKDDGRIVRIHMSSLSPESQAAVRSLSPDLKSKTKSSSSVGSSKSGGTSSKPELNLAPKCNVLVYEHPNFDVRFTSTATIMIQPKENGAPVGKALEALCQLRFNEDHEMPDGPDKRGKFISASYVKQSPLTILIKKRLEETGKSPVNFEHTFEFDGNKITITQQILDNKLLSLGGWIHCHKSHDFPFDTPLSEILKTANQCTLTIKPLHGKKKSETLKYGEAVDLNQGITEAVAEGAWGKRKITITGEKTDDAYLHIRNYSKAPLYERYSYLYHCLSNGKKPVKSGKLTITIE